MTSSLLVSIVLCASHSRTLSKHLDLFTFEWKSAKSFCIDFNSLPKPKISRVPAKLSFPVRILFHFVLIKNQQKKLDSFDVTSNIGPPQHVHMMWVKWIWSRYKFIKFWFKNSIINNNLKLNHIRPRRQSVPFSQLIIRCNKRISYHWIFGWHVASMICALQTIYVVPFSFAVAMNPVNVSIKIFHYLAIFSRFPLNFTVKTTFLYSFRNMYFILLKSLENQSVGNKGI